MWSQSRGSFAMKDLVMSFERKKKRSGKFIVWLNIIYFYTFSLRESGGRTGHFAASFQPPQKFFCFCFELKSYFFGHVFFYLFENFEEQY